MWLHWPGFRSGKQLLDGAAFSNFFHMTNEKGTLWCRQGGAQRTPDGRKMERNHNSSGGCSNLCAIAVVAPEKLPKCAHTCQVDNKLFLNT